MLLIHRFRQGHEYWVFPGGGVEEGETIEQALHREMLEETSLRLLRHTFLYEAGEQPHCLFYLCELESGEPRLGGPELAEQTPDNQHILEWVRISDAPSLPGLYPEASGLWSNHLLP
jgi:ADP-ribose pyrophosphatase YjhB (NUDIX family)